MDGERPRDGTCAGDKNARPGVSKGRFWRIVFSNPSRAGVFWVSMPWDACALVLALDGVTSVSWVGVQANTNSVPSRGIVRAMIARRRAGAIRALRIVDRLAIPKAQSSSLSRPVLRSA